MSQDMSYDEFFERLKELSERIAVAKAAQDSSAQVDAEVGKQQIQEFERRHSDLEERLGKLDKHGWAQFKDSMNHSLGDLITEFGQMVTEADEKFRHRK